MNRIQAKNTLELMPPGRRAGLLIGGPAALMEKFGLNPADADTVLAWAKSEYGTATKEN